MTDPRQARRDTQDRLTDALFSHIEEAIHDGLPSKAKQWLAVEDVLSIVNSAIERMLDAGIEVADRARVAGYLLTHVGGDESQAWQAGHNYAMTEAARLIRERWDLLPAAEEPNQSKENEDV